MHGVTHMATSYHAFENSSYHNIYTFNALRCAFLLRRLTHVCIWPFIFMYVYDPLYSCMYMTLYIHVCIWPFIFMYVYDPLYYHNCNNCMNPECIYILSIFICDQSYDRNTDWFMIMHTFEWPQTTAGKFRANCRRMSRSVLCGSHGSSSSMVLRALSLYCVFSRYIYMYLHMFIHIYIYLYIEWCFEW